MWICSWKFYFRRSPTSLTSTGSTLHERSVLNSHSKIAPILCEGFISLPKGDKGIRFPKINEMHPRKILWTIVCWPYFITILNSYCFTCLLGHHENTVLNVIIKYVSGSSSSPCPEEIWKQLIIRKPEAISIYT